MKNGESQFHYGSIKTFEEIMNYYNNIASQFHYGSIKTSIHCKM